jgi:hypothetical protein
VENVVNAIFTAMGNADSVAWDTVVALLSEREKRILHDTLRQLKREGRAWRRVSVVDGQTVLEIVRGAHPNSQVE